MQPESFCLSDDLGCEFSVLIGLVGVVIMATVADCYNMLCLGTCPVLQ